MSQKDSTSSLNSSNTCRTSLSLPWRAYAEVWSLWMKFSGYRNVRFNLCYQTRLRRRLGWLSPFFVCVFSLITLSGSRTWWLKEWRMRPHNDQQKSHCFGVCTIFNKIPQSPVPSRGGAGCGTLRLLVGLTLNLKTKRAIQAHSVHSILWPPHFRFGIIWFEALSKFVEHRMFISTLDKSWRHQCPVDVCERSASRIEISQIKVLSPM